MTDPYHGHACLGSYIPRSPDLRDLCKACARFSRNHQGWHVGGQVENGKCKVFIPLQIQPKESK